MGEELYLILEQQIIILLLLLQMARQVRRLVDLGAGQINCIIIIAV